MQTAPLTVGQRITYKGDMANAPGNGAIVSVDDGVLADVILDDGRSFPSVSAYSIGGEFGDKSYRFMLADGTVSEGEIATLRTLAALRVADRKARAAEQEAAFSLAKSQARAEGLKLGLLPADDFRAFGKRGTPAAHNLRAELKAAGIKARVRQDSYCSIYITVPAGDCERASAIASKYMAGHFDGMTDSYEYRSNAWGDVFGYVRYVLTRREE